MQTCCRLVGFLALVVIAACGGDSSSSSGTFPTPVSTPPPATFSVSGQVTDEAAAPIAAASVTILDGVNARLTATTDTSGRYTLTGLSSGGMTLLFRRTGYSDLMRPVTVTSATTLNVSMTRSVINLSGAMTGTFAVTSRNQLFSIPLTASVTQKATEISGTFTLPNGWYGSFQGTLSGVQGNVTYQGSVTVSALISTSSGRCNGTRSNVSGSATDSGLTLPVPGDWRWNECVSSERDITVTLTK